MLPANRLKEEMRRWPVINLDNRTAWVEMWFRSHDDQFVQRVHKEPPVIVPKLAGHIEISTLHQ
jgi:hypothetical protein